MRDKTVFVNVRLTQNQPELNIVGSKNILHFAGPLCLTASACAAVCVCMYCLCVFVLFVFLNARNRL